MDNKRAIDFRLSKDMDCDWVLQSLARFANIGAKTPITLTTGAGLVSGIVIGGGEYMDLLQKQVAQAWPGVDSETLDRVFSGWKETYSANKDQEPDENEAKEEALTLYIHLMDARVLNGGTFVPTSAGVLWRGKIDSIIGFTLGTLSLT